MVEVLQNILCKSKSFSLTLRNKSEVFRNEKVSKSSIFFLKLKKIIFFFVFSLHNIFGFNLLCFCLFNQLFLSFFGVEY